MSSSEFVGSVGTSGPVGSEESVWHTVVSEEPTGNVEVQLAIIFTPVNKEVYGEG